jgi:hypothetical protein
MAKVLFFVEDRWERILLSQPRHEWPGLGPKKPG